MSIRNHFRATGAASAAAVVIVLGQFLVGPTATADIIDRDPPIPCGPIKCPDNDPPVEVVVTYQEVNFHLDSINAGDGCGGEAFGTERSNGWCDGVFTAGHVAPFTDRAPGVTSWRSSNTLYFRQKNGGGEMTGTVPGRGSDRYTLSSYSLMPPGSILDPGAPSVAAGEKGGPLNINVVEGSGLKYGLYHFYVRGWVKSFTYRPVTPPSAGGRPPTMFGSS